MRKHLVRSAAALSLASALALPSAITARAGDAPPATPAASQPSAEAPETRPAVTPKPLSDQTKKALAWLIKQQQDDGGWSQGEISKDQYRQGEQVDRSNVADTCMAALALIRCGSTPGSGDYAQAVRRGVDFVCGQVEKAPQEGLDITDIKGTRVQTKLGQHIDTFAAALLLSEVRNTMPDEAGHRRVIAALDKTMDKIEKNQKEDGRWVDAHDGWASALAQSMASKAVNRAAQNGQPVSEATITRSQKFAAGQFNKERGEVNGDGSAGVELYARAGNLAAFQDADDTNASRAAAATEKGAQARQQLAVAARRADEAEKSGDKKAAEEAKAQAHQAQAAADQYDAVLTDVRENNENLKLAQGAVLGKLDDPRFIAGFGSNGGEEFLSHMNIGESLVQKGGEEFAKWDKSMTENLNRIQNDDGSWSGQHCITGRTFCTAAAVLVLTTDRSAQAPVAGKMRGK